MAKNTSSVLQSLTATYTDSEGEEDDNRKRRSPSLNPDEEPHTESTEVGTKESSVTASNASPDSAVSGTNTPQSGSSASAVEIRRVAARLVSYNRDDEEMSDNGTDDDEEDSNSRVEFPVIRASRPVSPDVEQLMPGEELLPPEPTGKCPADLQERIETMLKKKIDMNFSIQQRKQFRNPSIYEKLIEHLGIEEKGTNYPIELYDPGQWGEESCYENLSKLQREEMDKREKERRERTKVEFVSGTAPKKPSSGSAEDERKRKSKWDQTQPANNQSAILTSVPTGTKTAIPAFGTLPKKSKQT